jgi:hypothetical protein
MFIDTIYDSRGAMVVIAFENEAEQRFTDEQLIRIACSQDLLDWSYPDEIDPSIGKEKNRLQGRPLVTCPKGRKLRGPSPGERAWVHCVGDAVALVMIRDSVPAAALEQ